MTLHLLLATVLLAAASHAEAICRAVGPEGSAVVEPSARDGMKGVRACGYIAAPPESVYEALIDYATYPEWLDKVGATEVNWSTDVTAEVRLLLDLRWGEFAYTLRRTHHRPERITWKMTEGDWDAVEGAYHIRSTEDGHTLLFIEQFMDPGRYVPGFIERYFQQRASRRLLEDIQVETMRREKQRLLESAPEESNNEEE